MKKIKKILIAIVFMFLCVTPIFVGCELKVFGNKNKLDAPELTLHNEDNCFTFDAIEETDTYDVYCNSKVVDTYENVDELETIVYDFEYLLEESGEYKFYVVAISKSLYLQDSDPSNEVKKVYTKISTPTNNPTGDDAIEDINFSINVAGQLTFTPIQDIQYTLYMYSNNTGLKSYKLNANTKYVNLSSYISSGGEHDIYAVKLGYTDNGVDHISALRYYNTVNVAGYTDKIYMFDGYINDFYITTLPELKNIIYYSFIYRIEDFNIKLSTTFKDFVAGSYAGTYMEDKMNYAVHESILKGYFETRAYESDNYNGGYVKQLTDSTEFNIKISYYGVKECNTSIQPNNTYPQTINYGYYDRVDYEMLGDDYNSFASDNYYLSTLCSTSEQLYWAVENKITPIIEAGSRADKIYTKAKNVLRDIISEEMTDYEKVLSIFEWICLNTNYDYSDYNGTYCNGLNLKAVPTLLPCYYLEGVFETGYSVCDGFSKAYSLMCNMLGIDCIRVVGTAVVDGETGGHAWNKVFVDKDESDSVDGQYYLVDITWTELISKSSEEMSHLYFLLGDDEVKDTHFNFNGRSEFSNYAASENFYYYLNDTFTHEGQSYNFVMENEEEIEKIFDYTLDNQIKYLEFVVDLDIMIDYYNYVNGDNSYLSSNKVEYTYYDNGYVETQYVYSEDTLYAYSYVGNIQYVQSLKYYKLRSTFIECMRAIKAKVLKSQYFLITNSDKLVQYGPNNSDVGILYIVQPNLLIDSVTNDYINGLTDEPAEIVNYFNTTGISGTYTLYVNNEILRDFTGDYKQRLETLLSEYMKDANFSIVLKHISATDKEQVFELQIINYE